MRLRAAALHAFSLLLLFSLADAARARARLQRGYESDLKDADASLQAELGVLTTGGASSSSLADPDPLVSVALSADPFEVGADHPDQAEVTADELAAGPTAAPLGAQKLALWAASQGAAENSLQTQVNSLTAQNSKLQSDMAKAAALRIQTNQTQAELDRLRERMRPANIAELQEEAGALEKKHANLLGQLQGKDQEIARLERDMKPLRAKVRKAQKEAVDLKKRSRNTPLLQRKLQTARAEESRLRHTVDRLRQRLVALQGERKLPKESLVDAALARTENATALLETQQEMLRKQKLEAQKEADAEVAMMEDKVKQAETRRIQLEAGLRHRHALVADAKKNLTLLVRKKQKLVSERVSLQKQVKNLGPVEAELRKKGIEVKRLRKQVALLEKSVSTARSSLLFQDDSRLEEQAMDVRKENAKLQVERQQQEKQGLAMEVELKNAEKAIVKLRGEVGRAQTLKKHTAGVWRSVKSIDRENAALRRGIALLARRLKRVRASGVDAM